MPTKEKSDATNAPDTSTATAAATGAPIVTIESLQAENAALQAKIKELTESKALQDADEKVINEKMAIGLTRNQAISVLRRQRAYDASDVGKIRAQAVADFTAQKRPGQKNAPIQK